MGAGRKMIAMSLYRAATAAGEPVLRLHYRRRAQRGREEAARLDERFGKASQLRPEGPLVWLHAASVGESLSLLPLIDALRQREPGLNLLVTSGTRTSAQILSGQLPEGVVHQYNPADCPRWVNRFLDTWRPDLSLYVESELWPNMLSLTQKRGIPTGLLNARMSEKSYRQWQRLPSMIRPLMQGFSFCLAQNSTQAKRMAALGARDPRPLGNLKFTAKPLAVDETELARMRKALDRRPCWLAASTHPGEEAVATEVHAALKDKHPGLLTLIAIRHPERAEEVLEMLRNRGLRAAQRSLKEPIEAETDVYLADTMGEMGLFYRLAPMAFVGGSLTGVGGHNPIEPAHLDCAILHGPDMRNFSEVAEDLEEAGASWQVNDGEGLTRALDTLLNEPDSRRNLSASAHAVVQGQAGVLQAVLEELEPFLAPLRHPRAA